jgi:membrane protease YdiL (CAAX protease family)
MRTEHDRVDVRGVVSFVLLTYALAWLLTLPMWLTGEGLSWTWSPVVLIILMFVPGLSVLFVSHWVSPAAGVLRRTGVTNPGGIRTWWRYGLIAWLGPPVVMGLALVVGYLLGVYHADWTGFSGLAQQHDPTSPRSDVSNDAWRQIAEIFVLGWLNTIPAFGEEWGWRGYLTRALLPLGQPGAFLVTGVLWALWQTPLLVLGYNYPTVPIVAAVIMMMCFCTLVGTLLSWLRLASRSTWPAAIAHGFLNASAGMPMIFSAAGHPVNSATTGVLGWSGWLVLGVVILLLILFEKLPVRLPTETAGISRGVLRLRHG